jgi:hypothetical protein
VNPEEDYNSFNQSPYL